jgi:hypothetical protein
MEFRSASPFNCEHTPSSQGTAPVLLSSHRLGRASFTPVDALLSPRCSDSESQPSTALMAILKTSFLEFTIY